MGGQGKGGDLEPQSKKRNSVLVGRTRRKEKEDTEKNEKWKKKGRETRKGPKHQDIDAKEQTEDTKADQKTKGGENRI